VSSRLLLGCGFTLAVCTWQCGPSLPPGLTGAGVTGQGSAGALADYPGTLLPVELLKPDFSVRQKVAIRYKDKQGGFEAVLQKRGDQLLVVGLGPLGVRTFVLEQRREAISFKQNFGPPLPFPPRNILLDIQRAFFVQRSPFPADVQATSTATTLLDGVQDGERIDETWQQGSLKERSYRRPDTHKGAVRVRYQGPCNRKRCQPEKIVLTNEWYGYELTIENEDYEFFDDKPSLLEDSKP
jgi:Protein of unknown function (DUF3261)